VSKAISLSHIATTVILILSVVIYITDIEKSVAIHSEQIEALSERVTNIDQHHIAAFNKIDAKLDKLFDLLYKLSQHTK
jgi:GTP1/Obg family GTP-binding protein